MKSIGRGIFSVGGREEKMEWNNGDNDVDGVYLACILASLERSWGVVRVRELRGDVWGAMDGQNSIFNSEKKPAEINSESAW
jgi:hypothetical protein